MLNYLVKYIKKIPLYYYYYYYVTNCTFVKMLVKICFEYKVHTVLNKTKV